MRISFAERLGTESCTLTMHSIWVSTDLLKGIKGNKSWSKLKTKLKKNQMIWQNITQPESTFDLETIKQEFWLLTKCTYKNRQSASKGNPSTSYLWESHLFSSAISVTPSLTCAPYLVVSYSIPKGRLIGLSFQVINAELPNGMKIQVKFRR